MPASTLLGSLGFRFPQNPTLWLKKKQSAKNIFHISHGEGVGGRKAMWFQGREAPSWNPSSSIYQLCILGQVTKFLICNVGLVPPMRGACGIRDNVQEVPRIIPDTGKLH